MKDVCIVYAGDKFTPKHVEQKRLQLDTHCSIPTRLTVLTDDPATIMGLGLHDTRAIELPKWMLTGRQLWWYKVFMFSDSIDWSSDVLYLDLDTIILKDIAHFWTYETNNFIICQDFNRQFIPEYPVSNSSVMRFNPEHYRELHTRFEQERDSILRKFRGDQDYLTDWFKTRPGKLWWPHDWCMSYKWEIVHGGTRRGGPDLEFPSDYLQPDTNWVVPNTCCVAVFHGKPEVYDTEFGTHYTY